MARDDIRNVFRDPQPGDEIRYFGDTYAVARVERHPGKTTVHVVINGQENRRRSIAKDSWRAYEEDAEVLVNRSVVDAFDDAE